MSKSEHPTFGDVEVTCTGAVAEICFSRPPHNFFDAVLMTNIADALLFVDDAPEVRASVLRSEGKNFCAGANLSGEDFDPRPVYAQALRIYRRRKPLIAAVQGAATGGGLGLALAADLRVGSPESRFCANFASIGIHPGFGLTLTLPRMIGHQAATRLFLTGERVNGRQAYRLGLLDRLVPHGELLASARALATTVAAGAPLAVESARATLRSELLDALEKQIALEASEQSRLFKTSDYKEGIAAVHERRLGRWERK